MAELTISKSLNKAYRQVPVDRAAFDTFKTQLHNFFEQITVINTEEKVKGDLMDFLKLTFYGQNYKVSPNGKIDCAIHLGNNIQDPVGVIFEVKMPGNVSEMITREDLNRKALQELLLYYLRERHINKNIQLKQLIVTNIHEYFIFDAQEFERLFYSNKKLIKSFDEFNDGTLASDKTDFFYKEIAADFIAKVIDQINYTWFDIRKYKSFLDTGNDKRLIELFKFFSPEHLLKKRFQNDSNSLNTKFYSELLYIIGLEEVVEKDSNKHVITRRKEGDRNQASILVEACDVLGIRIPYDAAIIGVDNDEIICGMSNPPISSIDVDIERGGYEAAAMAVHMMKDPSYKGEDIVLQPLYIVTRESSNLITTKDVQVHSALTFIHSNVEHKILVPDVLAHVAMSRRLLEQRFLRATGKTIYQYISEQRVDHFAALLLDTKDSIANLAARMDEPDPKSLSRRFKEIKGCTPSEYRKKNLRKTRE